MKIKNLSKAGLIALLFALIITPLQARKMEALVRKVSGWAEYSLPASDNFRPLRPGLRLPYGTTVRTAEDGDVILRVVPGAAMKITPNSEIVVDGMEFEKQGGKVIKRKARIKLDMGTVSALLDNKDPEVTDFTIETPQGTAAARGTFYGVSYVDGQTHVSVKEGKVGLNEKKENE